MLFRVSNVAGRAISSLAYKTQLHQGVLKPSLLACNQRSVQPVCQAHSHTGVATTHGLGDVNPFILDEEDDGIVPEFYETVNPNIKPQWLVEGHQTHKTYASDNIWNFTAFTLAGVGLAFSMYRMYLVLNLNKK